MNKLIAIVVVLILQLPTITSKAQNMVEGKVVDKTTKEPLELAVIVAGSKGEKILTGIDGHFICKNLSAGDSISVSFIGYKPVTMERPTGHKMIIIELEKGTVDLKEIVISSHSNNLTSSHMLSNIDLNMQPVKSAQDLLRLVPGLFIAQHQGGGKAEQIFLRGFDADHGTDVNISVDGIPVNMVSHAHGQGYADLHFLIPETVHSYDFGKGPYYASKGDLCTAGYVAYETKNALEQNVVKLEGGQFATGRLVAMVNLLNSQATNKERSAYIATEALYSNGGPFLLPEHFRRFNLFGKLNTRIENHSKLTISLSSLSSKWRASGEIPARALTEGYLPSRWGTLDSAQGGYTTRTNASIKVITSFPRDLTWDNQLYYSHYNFNLISNFTFFYYFPSSGDEFRQHEIRDMGGYTTKVTKTIVARNTTYTSVAGAGLRYDHISPSELDHTVDGTFLSHLQLGKTRQLNTFAYFDETVETGRFLLDAGIRMDFFHFYYHNLAPLSDTFATAVFNGKEPYAQKGVVSPKFNVQYTLNPRFQLFFKSGKGFHSNDARVVIANQGTKILPAAYGAELGSNWKPAPRVFVNASLWYLFLKEEFTYGQDLIDQAGGPVRPSGRSSRTGIDFSLRYQLNAWLFANINVDLAKPRFIDSAAGNNYIPLAPTFTSTAGLDFKTKSGWNGGISYRYLHNRAANSTYSLTAAGYFITDLSLNYTQAKYEIGLDVQNLFKVAWNESEFEYVSRLKNETAAADQVSFTPGVPFFAKIKLSVFF